MSALLSQLANLDTETVEVVGTHTQGEYDLKTLLSGKDRTGIEGEIMLPEAAQGCECNMCCGCVMCCGCCD